MRTLSARLQEHQSSSQGSPTKLPAPSFAAGLHRILDAPKSPTYVGPTSAEFGLSGAQRSVSQEAGNKTVVDDQGEDINLSTTAPSPVPLEGGESPMEHPLRTLGEDEVLRLVQVYEDTVGVMYPCVDLDGVRAYALEYCRARDLVTESTSSPLSPQAASDEDWFSARDVQVLKILLATALLVESHGRSERAARLADSVEDRFASRLKIAEVDMKEILILTLLVGSSN